MSGNFQVRPLKKLPSIIILEEKLSDKFKNGHEKYHGFGISKQGPKTMETLTRDKYS
jgi:hypothetical protein